MVGSKVKLLDSGLAIAKRTKTLVLKNNLKNTQQAKGKIAYFTTGNAPKFSKVASKLLKHKVKSGRVAI
jgi:glutamate racemase